MFVQFMVLSLAALQKRGQEAGSKSFRPCYRSIGQRQFSSWPSNVWSHEGFLKEEDMTPKYKPLHDAYIWLMNMVSLYHDCEGEKMADYIDFKMHIYLQRQSIAKWRDNFKVDQMVWDKYLADHWEGNDEIPHWFIWVTKWFMHGLSGLFGSVSEIP